MKMINHPQLVMVREWTALSGRFLRWILDTCNLVIVTCRQVVNKVFQRDVITRQGYLTESI